MFEYFPITWNTFHLISTFNNSLNYFYDRNYVGSIENMLRSHVEPTLLFNSIVNLCNYVLYCHFVTEIALGYSQMYLYAPYACACMCMYACL